MMPPAASFTSRARRAISSYVGRLRGYHDLTESTNLDLGFVLTRTQRRRRRRRRRHRAFHDTALWRRRHGALAAAGARDLPPVRRTHRSIWSHRDQSDGPQRSMRHLRLRRLSVRAALVRWAGVFDRSDRADDASLRDSGQSFIADLLAERVQPVARPVPPHVATATARPPTSSCCSSSSAIGAHGAHPF